MYLKLNSNCTITRTRIAGRKWERKGEIKLRAKI